MRKIWVAIACFGLAGCVAPPVFTYVSLALDGASFVISGKSVSDHALSVAVAKDCAMWRAIAEQNVDAVCREYAETPDTAVATNRPAPRPVGYTIVVAEAPSPPARSAVAASSDALFLGVDPAKIPPQTAAPDAAPVAAVENRKAIYLVIGSFLIVDHAEQLAARVPGFATVIAPVLVSEERYYRVVTGPYDPGRIGNARSRLAAAGIGEAWAINLCTRDLGAPPCPAPAGPAPWTPRVTVAADYPAVTPAAR